MGRHAYLIMAHNEFGLLDNLLCDIDDKRNDIFLHIDKKTTGVDISKISEAVKNANIYLVPRMKVYWGGVYADQMHYAAA